MRNSSSSDRTPTRMTRSVIPLLVALCWPPVANVRAFAAEGEVLIFCTDSDRHQKEAKSLQGKKYQGKAEIIQGLPAQAMLAEIENRATAGKQIAAVEIIGHGNSSGPHTTADGAPKNPSDRLTAEGLREWASGLRQQGKDPKGFFAPGASIIIRACYVGKGELPNALVELLPAGSRVESDGDFYKNGALSAALGGFWGRKRVTTHDQDYIYLQGDKGDTVPWQKRDAGQDAVFVIGSWEGEAKVSSVKGSDALSEKTTMSILPGNFVIKEQMKEGKAYLELTFAGNVLIGKQDGNEAIFEPDAQRGGNMLAAKLTVSPEGKVLTGDLKAGKGELTITRELTLTRVK